MGRREGYVGEGGEERRRRRRRERRMSRERE